MKKKTICIFLKNDIASYNEDKSNTQLILYKNKVDCKQNENKLIYKDKFNKDTLMPSLNAEIIYSLKNSPLIYRIFKESELDKRETDIVFGRSKFSTIYHLINAKLTDNNDKNITVLKDFYQDLLCDPFADKKVLKDCLSEFFKKQPYSFLSVINKLSSDKINETLYERNGSESIIEKMLSSQKDGLFKDIKIDWSRIYKDLPEAIFYLGSEKLLREAIKEKPEFLEIRNKQGQNVLDFSVDLLKEIESYKDNNKRSIKEQHVSFIKENIAKHERHEDIIENIKSKIIFLFSNKRMEPVSSIDIIKTMLGLKSFKSKTMVNLARTFSKDIMTSHALLDSILDDLNFTNKKSSLKSVDVDYSLYNPFNSLYRLIKVLKAHNYEVEFPEHYFSKIIENTTVGILKSSNDDIGYEINGFPLIFEYDTFESELNLLMSQQSKLSEEAVYEKVANQFIQYETDLIKQYENYDYESDIFMVNNDIKIKGMKNLTSLSVLYVMMIEKSLKKLSESSLQRLYSENEPSFMLMINYMGNKQNEKANIGAILPFVREKSCEKGFSAMVAFVDTKITGKKVESLASLSHEEINDTIEYLKNTYPPIHEILLNEGGKRTKGILLRKKETSIIIEKASLHKSIDVINNEPTNGKINRL